jgi:cell wall-associated NlpC family hydrolase
VEAEQWRRIERLPVPDTTPSTARCCAAACRPSRSPPPPARPSASAPGGEQQRDRRAVGGVAVLHRGEPADPKQAAEQHISALYNQAEAATQQYDADQEQIVKLQAAIDGANSQSAQMRQTLDSLEGGLGRLAAMQYRNPAYSSTIALLFATQPEDYLRRAGMSDRVAQLDDQQIRVAVQTQRQLAELSVLGRQELQQMQAVRDQLASSRTTIQAELSQAQQQLDDLSPPVRQAVSYALSQGATGDTGAAAGTAGVADLDGLGTAISAQAPALSTLLTSVATDVSQGFDAARAQKAIQAAYAELGKPYIWGAVGPDGFDCSGLMQHVWSQAGVMLPRTSQEQAEDGPSVPLSQIQPGDLVIYFAGRTHVGMYVGNGLIIHASRPGSVVQFAAVNAMPINTIVRPDGG